MLSSEGYQTTKPKKCQLVLGPDRRGRGIPATCCLVNPDRERTVEKAFAAILEFSRRLREKYRL